MSKRVSSVDGVALAKLAYGAVASRNMPGLRLNHIEVELIFRQDNGDIQYAYCNTFDDCESYPRKTYDEAYGDSALRVHCCFDTSAHVRLPELAACLRQTLDDKFCSAEFLRIRLDVSAKDTHVTLRKFC